MSEQKLILKMPRWGVPLYGQILTWFFINVALVVFALWLLLRVQFGVSLGDVLTEQLWKRVEPRAELIGAELRLSSRDEWSGILAKRGQELGVRLAVMTVDGQWSGGAGLPAPLRTAAEEGGSEMRLPPRESFENVGERGRPESGGPNRPEDRRPPPPPPGLEEEARFVFHGKGSQGGRWIGAEIYLGGGEFRHPPHGVLTFYAKKGERNEVFVDWSRIVLIGAGLLVLSGLVWLPFVLQVTKRLRLMTEGAERISEGDFQVKVASGRGDEIGRLSRVIQRMSRRLGLLVDGQKRFLGDTAHELCSPLVRIRMGLGVLEQGLDGANQERLQAVEVEVGELARLVDELLAFSKASLAQGEVNFEQVFLHELCDEVGKREALGNECRVVGGQGLAIQSNADLLKRALGNLVRNAARYGRREAARDSNRKARGRGLDRGVGPRSGPS